MDVAPWLIGGPAKGGTALRVAIQWETGAY